MMYEKIPTVADNTARNTPFEVKSLNTSPPPTMLNVLQKYANKQKKKNNIPACCNLDARDLDSKMLTITTTDTIQNSTEIDQEGWLTAP